ncbi:ABC transporter permease [Streptomyces sp. SID8352]|uniref:ABC transporter permease n=1 Tax=Streptomyces sp. SID8352 TaxID=2690338 RepID=UPI00136D0DB1|nr:ABC transporter permease [Streptomyces sp. SID8352]MYU26311.1 ABC transporter permease subunit [Streptomyces sp. SID8352]
MEPSTPNSAVPVIERHRSEAPATPAPPGRERTAKGRALHRALRAPRRQPTLTAAGGTLLLFLLAALLGPLLWGHDPTRVDLGSVLAAPSAAHPMGTDSLGRDVFARFLAGARISLFVGLAVTAVGAVLGGTLGVVAGLARGRADSLFNWLINTLLAFPPLMLAMAVAVGLGAGTLSGVLGLVIASVPWFARVLRSEVIRIRSMPYVESAQLLGASRTWVTLRHVVPQVVPTLVIQAAAAFGWSVLTLAALGFIGLGPPPPTPEWGSMITDGLQYALSGQWWIGVFPGLGLLVAVTAGSVLADRARDILDPRGSYDRI